MAGGYRVQTGRNRTIYDGCHVGGRLWDQEEALERATNHAFGKGYAQMSPAMFEHPRYATGQK